MRRLSSQIAIVTRPVLSIFLLCGIAACGGGEDDAAVRSLSPTNINSSNTSQIVEVVARGQFTPSGLSISAGTKFTIKQIGGAWTGGQLRIDGGKLMPLFCGLEGCNGVLDLAGTPVPAMDSADRICGFAPRLSPGASLPAGRVVDAKGFIDNITLNLTATGEVAAPGATNTFSVNIPAGNTAQCCSPNKKMITAFVYGQPTSYVKNDCAGGKLSALIMKIVPEGQDLEEIAPIYVADRYIFQSYVANNSGKIYFGFNDLPAGHFDNSGSINIQLDFQR